MGTMKFTIWPTIAIFAIAATARAQVVFNFNVGNQGFTSHFIGAGVAGPVPYVWGDYPPYLQPPVQSNYWWYPGSQNVTTNVLVSPPMTVMANGQITGNFNHRFAMESQADGGAASVLPQWWSVRHAHGESDHRSVVQCFDGHIQRQ
jgi:hypothetical protein